MAKKVVAQLKKVDAKSFAKVIRAITFFAISLFVKS